MGLRELRRKYHQERKNALKRFRRQKVANLLAKPGYHQFVVVLDHLKPAFNIGKIIRSADAFGACEVHLVGIDYFDPAPAMGSFKWVPARFHDNFAGCFRDLNRRGFTFFTLEPDIGESLPSVRLPNRSAFVLGHEEFGLSFNKSDFEGIKSLTVPQFGKVQSLNVSIAASIVMYEYVRQHHADFR